MSESLAAENPPLPAGPSLADADRFVSDVGQRLALLLERENPPAARPGNESGHDLWAAARHTCLADRAKRVRPRLVFLFGQAVCAPREALIDVAVAAELIHAASLVHDDVIDSGTVRRGRPTVNVLWNNIRAVLCGDLMFSIAFGQLRPYPSGVVMTAVDVLAQMSCSAIDEVQARQRFDLSNKAWQAIAEGKAGALFGWCGAAPARISDNEDAADRFDRCGRALGVAFQLADDLKDLVGDDGKNRFADVRNQNPSWPLLWARDQAPKVAHLLADAWSQDTVTAEQADHIGYAVIEAGAIPASLAAIRQEVAAGLDALGPYRDRPGVVDLAHWAEGLLKKEHI